MTSGALLFSLALFAQGAVSQEGTVPPLFDSHELLTFTLRADLNELKGDRSQESEERPAVIDWTDADGSSGSMGMKLRTRGKFRLKKSTCSLTSSV